MKYNIDVKWQKGVDDQKGDFAIKNFRSLEVKFVIVNFGIFIKSQVAA